VISMLKPLHFASLNAIKKRVCQFYADQGYPHVKIALTATEFESGILRFLVLLE